MEELFDAKLQEWAKETVDYCLSIATAEDSNRKINRAFYAFQSKPIKNPEVLILAINPAGDAYYIGDEKWKGQCENEIWNIPNGMTPKRFIQENPNWNEHETWRLWQGLFGIFKSGEINYFLDKDKFMYMNVLYFNSNTISDFFQLPKTNKEFSKEVFGKCVKLTKEAIEILKPKRILCLSILSCFNNIKDIEKIETIIDKTLVRGTLNNIPIYGIPHTSRPIKGGQCRLGRLLKELFDNDQENPISKDDLIKNNKELFDYSYQPSTRIPNMNNLVVEIKNQLIPKIEGLIKEKQDKETTVDFILKSGLEIRISATNKGYVAVRVPKDLDDNKIKNILNSKSYNENVTGWLGFKSLISYNSDDAVKISKEIIEELKDLANI